MLRHLLCSAILAAAAATAACRPAAEDAPAPPPAPGSETAAVEDARQRYREAVRLAPEDGAAYLELSRLEASAGAYDEAVAVAAEGVRNVPGDAKLRTWYGETLLKRGRRAEAEEVLRRTLELDDAGAYPHYVLGLVYLGDGRLAAARRELEAATALQASAHEAWYQLAVVCERLGDLEARDLALEQFTRLYRQRLGAGG
jgi:tetratricopeptide (TPR) repeat protein